MADEDNVRIIEWPKEPARLEHSFVEGDICPVSVSFEQSPAHVILATRRESPLMVNMNMNLSARETIPLCIKLCEPICAESDYVIGITLFDRPIITIRVKGVTKLFNCGEEL